FRSGAYNPGTQQGFHLLAHETTHVVQQAAGPVAGTPTSGGVSISDPADPFERAAEAAADRIQATIQRKSSGDRSESETDSSISTLTFPGLKESVGSISSISRSTLTIQRSAVNREEAAQTSLDNALARENLMGAIQQIRAA